MKEQTQQPGVRKWAGDDMIALQAEPLSAIQGFFEEYGNCIIKGCAVVPAAGGKYNIAPGLLGLSGMDANGVATFKVVPFSGVENVTLPLYFTLTHSVVDRVYGDGKVKPIAYDYRAAVSAVKPAAGVEFLELTTAGGRRFVDAVKITEKLDKVGNGKDVTVTFSQAASRVNIASGEKLTIILGKIVRWLADLKALAFKDKVSKADLDTALQGEVDGKHPKGSIIKAYQTQESNYSYFKSENVAENICKMNIGTCYGYNTPVTAMEIENGNVYLAKKLLVSGNEAWHAGNFNPATKEPVFTKNTAFNKNFGTAAGTVCQGNDERLTNARPANGGNAETSGTLLITDNRPNHGNGLIMNQNIDMPGAPNRTDYFSYLRLLHPNPEGYFSELAMPFTNSTRMYFRNMINGVLGNWNPIAFLSDIPVALPANGGNADTVDGLHAAAAGAVEGGKLASYDANSYMNAIIFKDTWPADDGLAVEFVGFKTSIADGYHRFCSLSRFKAVLGNMPPSAHTHSKSQITDFPTNFVTTDTVQTISGAKTFTAYCDFRGGGGNSGSDMRFKKGITPVENILPDLLDLDLIRYTWAKPGETQRNTFGLSASQLLEKGGVFGKIVHERGDEEATQWVEYDRVGVLALKGLQEIARKTEDENATLRQELNSLRQEMAAIREHMQSLKT